jgi:MFS family permease
LVSLFASAAWCLVLVGLENRAAILGGVFMFALAGQLYGPASQAMLADLTPEPARPHAYAVMYMALNLGFAFGTAVGGQIAGRSFFWLFASEAIATGLFGLLVLLRVPESHPDRSDGTASGRHVNLSFVTDRPFVALLLAYFLLGLLFQQPFSTLPLVMARAGLTPDIYGSVIALNGLMIAVLQLPFTAMLAKRRAAPSLAIAAVLLGVGFGLNAIAVNVAGYAFSIAVWTLGEIVLFALIQAAVAAMAPPARRASYFGAFTAAFGLSMMIGPVAGGVILDRAGAAVLWGSCVLVGLVPATIFASLGTRLDARGLSAASRWS